MFRADAETMPTFEFQPRKVGGLRRLSPDPPSYSRQRRNIPTPPAAPTVPDSPTPTRPMDRPVADSDTLVDNAGMRYVIKADIVMLQYNVGFLTKLRKNWNVE